MVFTFTNPPCWEKDFAETINIKCFLLLPNSTLSFFKHNSWKQIGWLLVECRNHRTKLMIWFVFQEDLNWYQKNFFFFFFILNFQFSNLSVMDKVEIYLFASSTLAVFQLLLNHAGTTYNFFFTFVWIHFF